MRRLVIIAIVGGGLALGMPLVAQDQLSPEEQKDWFVGFVEGQLSTPERQIRLSNIDGALSSQASIREITISDQEGVWLRISNAAIDWDQGALFTGRLLVRELKADSIEFLRNAVPSDEVSLPAPEAPAIEVPEFPVAIQLDKLSVPRVTFGAGVFGLGSEIALDGSLKLEGGSLISVLDVTRLDGPGGRLAANVAYTNGDNSIDVALTLTEPPNGIVANLLNIEGRPEIALGISGMGPIDNLVTAMTLDAGGVRALEGSATIAGVADGLSIKADLGGPIATLMAPDYRAFFGAQTRLTAEALVKNAGGVDIPRLSLSGGQLALEGSAATSSDGFLNGLLLSGVIADPNGAPVTLPVPGGATSIARADLRVDFGSAGDDNWNATIAAQGFSNGELAAREVSIAASGVAANLTDPTQRRITFNADGTIGGIASDDADITAALGDGLGFGLAGLWSAEAPVQIAELRLVGKALTLALNGNVDAGVFDGQIGIETSSIAPFSGLAGRDLAGALSLTATGTISALNGGFDLTLDGAADNLQLDPAIDRVLAGRVDLAGRLARNEDGFVAQGFRLGNDRIALTADGRFATGTADFGFGAELSDLSLLSDNASGRLLLTGAARGTGDIALLLDGQVPEGQLAGKPLQGARFGFEGTLREDGSLLGQLSGNAALAGTPVTLEGHVGTSEAGRRLSGLRFAAGPTLLEGDVTQGADGLINGLVALSSTDVSTAAALAAITASGSANLRVVLMGENGQQAAQVSGQIADLRADDVRVGSADISGTLSDLFGTPAINGTVAARQIVASGFTIDRVDAEAAQSGETTNFSVTATAESDRALADAGLTPVRASARGSLAGRMATLDSLSASGRGGLEMSGSGRVPLDGAGLAIDLTGSAPLALGNRFVADRGGQLSGTATLRAGVRGSLQAPEITASVSTEGAGYVDPELNLRLVGINGSASLAGERVVIDNLSAALSTGGSVNVSGSVGLGGNNAADIAVRLDNARYADGTMLVATVAGDLRLTGELQRDPLLSGSVRIEQADISIPDNFGGAAALIEADHVNTPTAAAATLARARIDQRPATAGNSGRASAIQLDIDVLAPNQIFLRGRGLDAEVGGQVKLTGSVNDIRPVGGFELSRGRLAILGQRVTFEEGMVTLVGDLDPYIDFRARTEGDGINVFVDVTGPVSDLGIGFSSTPALPQDEVMSRLLFKRSMGELTPLQLAKLAAAAAELAGGSNPSLVDSLRAKAGLADLDVVTTEDGNLAVQAGAYVQDNVYLGVQAGADGNSRVTINLDLGNDVKAKAATGLDGDTSVGIFYETDY